VKVAPAAFDTPQDLLVVLIIVLLLFGSTRIPDFALRVGQGIRGLKRDPSSDFYRWLARRNPWVLGEGLVVERDRTREVVPAEMPEGRGDEVSVGDGNSHAGHPSE
jgi:TatA/E family protein of Tat protein translocase